MQPTTITTVDENGPDVRLVLHQGALDAVLLDHFRTAWISNGAVGECPATWHEILEELKSQDLLYDRDVAHFHVHDLFADPIIWPLSAPIGSIRPVARLRTVSERSWSRNFGPRT
ncbi:hypothetical protein KM176_22285 [Pseudooceanicola sp. CBS1P-1]|uniref:Uncharacterized protein n=1 Tax=Pseudooceanicola albus TaxID=2692189 RepID=A0A6L7GBS5_9RHOB|nr:MULTISPECIES: hypothetical protein [Pseudooceanicola]MBT9386604.1 hypothetical protein [Pseudooceanicola endophyticus]MXN20720.1 hypothetical protein [Pseudooceanicola albus]